MRKPPQKLRKKCSGNYFCNNFVSEGDSNVAQISWVLNDTNRGSSANSEPMDGDQNIRKTREGCNCRFKKLPAQKVGTGFGKGSCP